MQAIRTTFLSPTNSKGARLKASAQSGSLIVLWDHGQGVEDNHRNAASKLRAKLGWDTTRYGRMVCGQLPDGSFAHVFQE